MTATAFLALLLAGWPNPDAGRADLALPQNWPNDPNYGYLIQQPCPDAPDGGLVWRPHNGQWNLWGFYPPDTPDPCNAGAEAYRLSGTLDMNERTTMNGTGMSADVAWTMTTGDPRVLIAVHDCGAEWSEPDLVNKWFLNKGELPLPELADGGTCPGYDCNGDGVFNVLDYTQASGHTQPKIALVTDPRITGYKCANNPSCGGDTNGNGLLDPEDLIVIFSNGKDDDGNGFVDDISGWDFYRNTNDPIDDIQYGHGTGEAQDSSAEANNGIDSAGICPDCRVMMVRVADSFVGDSNHFADGVYYSLGMGANVIQEALGTLDNTPLMQDALNAAYAQGAIVVASAGDEDSTHHDYPGSGEHTLLVHAVVYDTDEESATSFLFWNNCGNAGSHIVLSTPGQACSSEATGKSSGEAGLIYSAMLKYNPTEPPLTAGEVMQLMWMNSEDINIAGSATNENLFPSGPGWDLYFGYGRNDCGASVAAVKNGQIPPEVDVTSPTWFQQIDPTVSPMLTITGHVSAQRAASYDYTVQIGAGAAPDSSSLQTVASTMGSTTPLDGVLATVSIADLIPASAQSSMDPNAFAATVIVSAVAHYGGSIGDVPGTFRKQFFVHSDPDLFTGYPRYMGASGDCSAHFAPLAGGTSDQLVIATNDGFVHALLPDGGELAGWPVQVQLQPYLTSYPGFAPFSATGPAHDAGQAFSEAVAVGSLNGDGTLQVVASTQDGQLYAWNADGTAVAGFPVSADPTHYVDGTHDTTLSDGTQVSYILGKGFFAAPTLYDLGGDGKLEIIQPGEDGWLYVWDSAGNAWPGFPVQVYDPDGGMNGSAHQIEYRRMMTTAAVGDINGDGKPEIVVGTDEVFGKADCRAYALWSDGVGHDGGPYLPGWPIDPAGLDNSVLPDIGVGVPNAAAMADLNGDGVAEVEINGLAASPLFYDGTGKQIGTGDTNDPGANATITDLPSFIAVSAGSFGDVDGDGKVDFVDGTVGLAFLLAGISGTGRVFPSDGISAWSAAANYQDAGIGFLAGPLPLTPAAVPDEQFFMNYSIADIDGDGQNEIVSGSGVYLMTAYRADGTSPTGWPKNVGGWMTNTPAFGDFDGDGKIDIATMTREGYLFVWHGQGSATQKIEWNGYHHDPQNTGNYATPPLTAVKTPDGGPATDGGVQKAASSGCSCTTGSESGLFGLLGLALWRRRAGRRTVLRHGRFAAGSARAEI